MENGKARETYRWRMGTSNEWQTKYGRIVKENNSALNIEYK